MRKSRQRVVNDLRYAIKQPDPAFAFMVRRFRQTKKVRRIVRQFEEDVKPLLPLPLEIHEHQIDAYDELRIRALTSAKVIRPPMTIGIS